LAVTANPDGTLQVGRGIKVGGDKAYQDTVVQQLALMNDTTTGHALIDDYNNNTTRNLTIRPQVPAPSPPNAGATPVNPTNASNGTGSDSNLGYNPNQWPNPVNAPNVPGDVILFHEMTHADHAAHGTRDRTPRADGFRNEEEFNTIQDENRYRNERGAWPGMPADNQRHDPSLAGA